MKQKYLILLCLIVLITILFFYFSSNGIDKRVKRIARLDRTIKIEQEKLNSAKVLNEQLQQVSKVIRNSISEKDLFTTEEANAFIKRLADLADKYKIAIYAMYPKPITTVSRRYAEHLYTMEINCTFVQMGQLLSDLESFDNIIRVKTLDVRPQTEDKKTFYDEQQETHYKVTLELSTYKIVKEA
ncbi:MAG: type 4a pilus biogenesis protein PilO [Candidatus Cloacimonetes bacterium]|nr:type 4a pilus biogenesis protein PilO [Candidatus Cloacimonadota bacterium]